MYHETRLTQPKRAAQPSNEIQSTNYYVRIYQRIMQNKPNFQKSQMNVKSYNTTDYENKSNWTLGESKPNSNPIKPNLPDTQMSVNSILTKDYEGNDIFAVPENKPNSNPISKQLQAPHNRIWRLTRNVRLFSSSVQDTQTIRAILFPGRSFCRVCR